MLPALQLVELSLQCLAVPLCQIGSGFVAALEKVQQGLFGRRSAAHVIITQEEFTHLGAIERRGRAN